MDKFNTAAFNRGKCAGRMAVTIFARNRNPHKPEDVNHLYWKQGFMKGWEEVNQKKA